MLLWYLNVSFRGTVFTFSLSESDFIILRQYFLFMFKFFCEFRGWGLTRKGVHECQNSIGLLPQMDDLSVFVGTFFFLHVFWSGIPFWTLHKLHFCSLYIFIVSFLIHALINNIILYCIYIVRNTINIKYTFPCDSLREF